MAGHAAEREEERAKRRQHVLEGENHVLKLIIEGSPLAAILEAIVEIAETQSTDGLLASILLLDEDRIHLKHGAAPNLPVGYNQAIDGLTIGPHVGSCGTAAYLRRQVIVSDITVDPLWQDFRDLAHNYGLRACWSTPILAPNKSVMGTFALYYREPRVPDGEDQEIIEILTRTTALAIEHVRAEQRLGESEERFRSLSRCAPVGVFMTDSAGVFRYVNPRFVETGSFDYEKTLDYWLENATRQTEAVERVREAMRVRSEFAGEFVISRDRSGNHISLRMAPLRTNAGDYLGYVGTVEDISSRVSGELALDKEFSLRRAIEDSIPSGIAVVSTDGTQTYVNRAFAAMVGWPHDELVGARAPFVYWPEEQLDNINRAFGATLRGEAPRDGFELSFRRKSGELFDALVSLAPLRSGDDEIDGWVASVSDITEHKRFERKLARSEARLAMALDAGRLGAWEWDIRSGEITWSPQLEALHGLERGTFPGTFEAFQADINPEHRPRVLSAIQLALETKESYEVSYEIVRPDHSRGWLQARGRVLCDEAGTPERMIGVCMDLSGQKASG